MSGLWPTNVICRGCGWRKAGADWGRASRLGLGAGLAGSVEEGCLRRVDWGRADWGQADCGLADCGRCIFVQFGTIFTPIAIWAYAIYYFGLSTICGMQYI